MNESTVIALGFFDGVHIGHGELLKMAVRRAQERGHRVFAVPLGKRPARLDADGHRRIGIQNLRHRMSLLRQYRAVSPFLVSIISAPAQKCKRR